MMEVHVMTTSFIALSTASRFPSAMPKSSPRTNSWISCASDATGVRSKISKSNRAEAPMAKGGFFIVRVPFFSRQLHAKHRFEICTHAIHPTGHHDCDSSRSAAGHLLSSARRQAVAESTTARTNCKVITTVVWCDRNHLGALTCPLSPHDC